MTRVPVPRQGPDRAPTVAIVGGANVGKSSLFNRLAGKNRALASRVGGTTRDVLTAYREEDGGPVRYLDTPPEPEEAVIGIAAGVDLVLLVTDATCGCTPGDLHWAAGLRRAGVPVLVVVNKTESPAAMESVGEFYRLGAGDPVAVSAAHGAGIAGLRESILERLRTGPRRRNGASPSWLNIALVGRPNVGKSSLGNRLLGEARSAVAEAPGTTRDRVEGWCRADGDWFRILDTAGGDRRIRDPLLSRAAGRTRGALEECDVAVLVLDARGPVRGVDRELLSAIHRMGKPAVIVGNKADLLETGRREFQSVCRTAFSFAGEPPVLLLSARTGQGCRRLLPTAVGLGRLSARRFSTGRLHEFLCLLREDPRRNRPRLRHAVQIGVRPPQFLFFHSSRRIPAHYRSFLHNRLRRFLGLEAVPIRIRVRRC